LERLLKRNGRGRIDMIRDKHSEAVGPKVIEKETVVNGEYVGRLSADDPLYDFLAAILRDQMGFGNRVAKFRVFRLNGTHEVYGYQEKYSHARIICKFYGPRFTSDPGLAAIVAHQESDNLDTLLVFRGYAAECRWLSRTSGKRSQRAWSG